MLKRVDASYWMVYALLATCAAASPFLSSAPSIVKIHGGCPASTYALIKGSTNADSAITFCQKGNEDQMQIETSSIQHGRYLEFSYIGYTETKGELWFLRLAKLILVRVFGPPR